jgi:hypothetical protein
VSGYVADITAVEARLGPEHTKLRVRRGVALGVNVLRREWNVRTVVET